MASIKRRGNALSRRAANTLADLSRDKTGPLWPWRTPDIVSHSFREICQGNGIENLRFHDLRHEATSRLFERGGLNVMEVSMITGHKTLQMLQRYTHPDPEKVRDKLDARIQA